MYGTMIVVIMLIVTTMTITETMMLRMMLMLFVWRPSFLIIGLVCIVDDRIIVVVESVIVNS